MNYPQFSVCVDPDRGTEPHAGNSVPVWLLGADHGDQDIYRLLCAGQYQIEGGYHCMPPCQARHPALKVTRTDSPLSAVETVWPAPGPGRLGR